MSVVVFPAREPRPRITQETLAILLIEKAATGDPGAVHLLEKLQRLNQRLFNRLAEGPAEVVDFKPRSGESQ